MTESSTQAVCPFPHTLAGVHRSRADNVVRSLLRVPESSRVSEGGAVTAFRRSMLFSTIRCTLTYLVFPFVLPALGLVADWGIAIGMVVGLLAMTCDVFAIRRFFAVDHRWRWQFSSVALGVVTLLAVLLVQDIVQIVS